MLLKLYERKEMNVYLKRLKYKENMTLRELQDLILKENKHNVREF